MGVVDAPDQHENAGSLVTQNTLWVDTADAAFTAQVNSDATRRWADYQWIMTVADGDVLNPNFDHDACDMATTLLSKMAHTVGYPAASFLDYAIHKTTYLFSYVDKLHAESTI